MHKLWTSIAVCALFAIAPLAQAATFQFEIDTGPSYCPSAPPCCDCGGYYAPEYYPPEDAAPPYACPQCNAPACRQYDAPVCGTIPAPPVAPAPALIPPVTRSVSPFPRIDRHTHNGIVSYPDPHVTRILPQWPMYQTDGTVICPDAMPRHRGCRRPYGARMRGHR